MSHQDDTKPKAPEGLREALQAPLDPNATPPSGINRVEVETPSNGCQSLFLLVVALGLASALCALLVGLAGVAGVRDEWQALSTQAARTQVAEVATQYHLGNQDMANGNLEMAAIRFQSVQTLNANYQEVGSKMAEIELILSYTPTPTLTPTALPPTRTPEPTLDLPPSPEAQASDPNQLDAAQLFGRAESAMNIANYEEAISWLDVLVLVDSNYRREDVKTMRLNALMAQGRIYLRGQNEDGQDRLAQGVQLIYRAGVVGNVPGELLYEADFVARYLAARAYVEGGALDQARAVLVPLCEEDCDWSYRGRQSVRELLARSGG